MKLRSKNLLQRPTGSFYRCLFKAMDYTDDDLSKPIIAIANSWNTVCPGHFDLNKIADHVRKGIQDAGGTVVEFGVIGACDGMAQVHEGMRYILPTRELIASDIEAMVHAHPIDAMVMLGSCDKIIPGMLIAAARLDIPAILVNSGPMVSNKYTKWNVYGGDKLDTASVMEATEEYASGKMDYDQFVEIENTASCGSGSCQFFGTANSMACFAEALGLMLPGTSTIPAVYKERLQVGYDAGTAIMKLLEQNITAKKIITGKSIENALKVSSAAGGSTNIILHTLALAYEAEIELTLDDIEAINGSVPQLTALLPSSKYDVEDFHNAGGVQALMKELKDCLDLSQMTSKALPHSAFISDAKITNPNVIKTFNNPISTSGGLCVLKGNLASEGAITKTAGIARHNYYFQGPAVVFDGEDAAITAIKKKVIKAGDVVVIRYEGPKGGPGMPEMWAALKFLGGQGLLDKVAVITDGRYSGSNHGLAIGYVSPEAQEGGPIAALQNGDIITIDINKKEINADIPGERLKSIKIRDTKKYRGYLGLYAKVVSSAAKGAIIELD